VTDGLAGGICQLSSTLYMAAIRANLQIVARSNHSYTVPYCPYGEDATVYYGALDFKFKNNTENPVKIEAIQKANYVQIRMLGKKTRNIEVKTTRTILSKTNYTTKTIVDPTLAPGTSVVDQEGQIGLTCDTYKIVYEDGKEIERTLLNTSRYIPINEVVRVGPTPTPPPVVPPAPAEPTPEEPTPEDPGTAEPEESDGGLNPLDLLHPNTTEQ
jgi:hypothetical protein